jgi:K+ transporter
MLQAFNPYYAFDYLIRNQYQGWRSLGGILLCFTGVEVLFAGIGAFSRQAIQRHTLAKIQMLTRIRSSTAPHLAGLYRLLSSPSARL